MYKIKTFNTISSRGLELFDPVKYSVGGEEQNPHAILLRSHRLDLAAVTQGLRAVARAGAGVNNIPVSGCTEQGIVVFNTPGANANAVKELVLAALLLSTRDIIGGMQFVSSLSDLNDSDELNQMVESEKKQFKGSELLGKSLGVVGLGAIGSMVARSALDLGMEVLGFDPAISVDAAWRLPSNVQRMDNLPSLFSKADYVTLHVPLLPETEGLVNEETLRSFRKGSVLLNFARQPIVDSSALKSALDDGHIGSYIADFPVPEIAGHPSVKLTPHLGASTQEAEENCAIMAAQQLTDFLETGNIKNSVNFPEVTLEPTGGSRLAITNRNIPGALGQITSILAKNKINVVDMLNKSREKVAYNLIDITEVVEGHLLRELAELETVISVREFQVT
ncbi:MAG: 3-phosphoglycerate dehydrogenase [Gammaproteobacteria bacterium]|nr:3-phosphoglycerate dehydrogenase [Gammaproteobacteria bacterium]